VKWLLKEYSISAGAKSGGGMGRGEKWTSLVHQFMCLVSWDCTLVPTVTLQQGLQDSCPDVLKIFRLHSWLCVG